MVSFLPISILEIDPLQIIVGQDLITDLKSLIPLLEYYWRSGMYLAESLVGFRRDDREGLDLLSFWILPMIPNPASAKYFSSFRRMK